VKSAAQNFGRFTSERFESLVIVRADQVIE
jgi:hypothetical protein